MLFALLGAAVMMIAERLQQTVDEPVPVPSVRLDVVSDCCNPHDASSPAHTTQRLGGELHSPALQPDRQTVPPAPRLLFAPSHVVDNGTLLAR